MYGARLYVESRHRNDYWLLQFLDSLQFELATLQERISRIKFLLSVSSIARFVAPSNDYWELYIKFRRTRRLKEIQLPEKGISNEGINEEPK